MLGATNDLFPRDIALVSSKAEFMFRVELSKNPVPNADAETPRELFSISLIFLVRRFLEDTGWVGLKGLFERDLPAPFLFIISD